MRISDWSSDVCSSDLSKVGPEHLRDFERRRSLRFVLPRQEDITLIVDGQPYRGKLEDVSIGGAKLRMADSVPAAAPAAVDVRPAHGVAGTIAGLSMWHAGAAIAIPLPPSDHTLPPPQ